MHDIRFIRDHPEDFDAALARRGMDPLAALILDIDTRRRALQGDIQELQSRRNQASKEIGMRKGKGEDADALIAEVNDIKSRMPTLEEEEGALATSLDEHLMGLPNILDAEVPDGGDEADNKLVREWGETPTFEFTPRDHVAIGEGLGQMDFAVAAKLAGSRFV
ncbi:MAG: serine--tRNA ligase, partial [Candidatus Puniceispirillaceae bacterium]